jgi:hypothetical protein
MRMTFNEHRTYGEGAPYYTAPPSNLQPMQVQERRERYQARCVREAADAIRVLGALDAQAIAQAWLFKWHEGEETADAIVMLGREILRKRRYGDATTLTLNEHGDAI